METRETVGASEALWAWLGGKSVSTVYKDRQVCEGAVGGGG